VGVEVDCPEQGLDDLPELILPAEKIQKALAFLPMFIFLNYSEEDIATVRTKAIGG